ncbi:MAG: substrate-binding domain-containing protein [Kiritimatiellae bacterium]|nr:substrate-binding domain-containing protein [Kiritimatiellia bacterium]
MRDNMDRIRHIGARVVLLFAKPRFHSHRERINGAYAAAIERGWQIQQIAAEPTAVQLRKARLLWNPIGCVLEPSVVSVRLDRQTFGDVPVVLMGCGEARRVWKNLDCSLQNSREPAVLAVEELHGLGLSDFAFIGDMSKPRWSVERGTLFKAALPQGASFASYAGPDPSTMQGRKALAAWLRARRRPCGCFLAADHLAAAFYAAADEAKLRVGIDLPTLGVDNDERCCLSLTPALSSIQLDFFQSGVNAIIMLERRLAHPEQPPQRITYGTLGIVRRASTNPNFRDHRVTKGMALVNAKACGALSVNDVAAEMGCCRRLAETLFRRHIGSSILNAIRKVRLEKAYALLRNKSVPIDAIPSQCGYAASPAYLKTYFRRQTGLTMREWRAKEA